MDHTKYCPVQYLNPQHSEQQKAAWRPLKPLRYPYNQIYFKTYFKKEFTKDKE